VNDAGVRAILLQVDSLGGKTTGGLELSDFIYSIRGAKPIYAVADDFAFSASYALTSAADRIFITRMGAVGSVGVVVLHTEDSKFNDEQGFKYTYIFKGDRKVDGSPIIDRQAPVDAGASPFSRPLAGIGHPVPFGRKKRAVEMPGLWKAWKAKNRLPTLSRRERRIYRTPGQGLPTSKSGIAPLRGVYFCTRPVRTSAV
jgi:hypothetical protein